MRKFKNTKTGAIYNVIVDSIAKMFENDSQYTEISNKKTSKKEEKNEQKANEEEEKQEEKIKE